VKYTDFFSNFYMGRNSGGILGHKSKEKIPEYFLKAALPEEFYDYPYVAALTVNGLMVHVARKT